MAEATLTGEVRPVTLPRRRKPQPTDLAYSAWKLADAEWEVARYQPEYAADDLPDEQNDQFCDRVNTARRAYFLTPAEDFQALESKMYSYRNEYMYNGGDCDGDLFKQLLADLGRLMPRENGRG